VNEEALAHWGAVTPNKKNVITVDTESLIGIFAHSVYREVTQYGETRRNAVASCQQSDFTKTVWLALHVETYVCTTRSVFVGIKTFMTVIEILSHRNEVRAICLF
jgi:hypothetical protein